MDLKKTHQLVDLFGGGMSSPCTCRIGGMEGSRRCLKGASSIRCTMTVSAYVLPNNSRMLFYLHCTNYYRQVGPLA